MKKYLFLGIVSFFVIAAILILRPVPIIFEDEALLETGRVSTVFTGGVNDVVIKLENNAHTFYINRGTEAGLVLSDLKEKLIGDKIVIKYPKYWTPLDWNNQIRHVSKVEFNDEVIFNELKT